MTIQNISTHASNILETIAFVLVALACIASAIASFLNFHFDQEERAERRLTKHDSKEIAQFKKFLNALDAKIVTPEQFADTWAEYLEMSRDDAIAYYKRITPLNGPVYGAKEITGQRRAIQTHQYALGCDCEICTGIRINRAIRLNGSNSITKTEHTCKPSCHNPCLLCD